MDLGECSVSCRLFSVLWNSSGSRGPEESDDNMLSSHKICVLVVSCKNILREGKLSGSNGGLAVMLFGVESWSLTLATMLVAAK